MGRPNYVCTICSEHFTRKYSAKRHNLTVHHDNRGEIVPLVEYLVRRSSSRYQACDQSWYRRSEKSIHKFGRAMVADSVRDTLRTRALQRQQQEQYPYHQQSLEEQERYHRRWQQGPSIPSPTAAIQDQPPDVLPGPTDLSFQSQSMNTTDDEEKTTLSQETRLKIAELKRLIYRYSRYHHNPAAVINCIIYYCNNGDNTLLDEKLEQLRTFDSMGHTGM
jgi:hypothetical protein